VISMSIVVVFGSTAAPIAPNPDQTTLSAICPDKRGLPQMGFRVGSLQLRCTHYTSTPFGCLWHLESQQGTRDVEVSFALRGIVGSYRVVVWCGVVGCVVVESSRPA
jgi:hypothetical protein